MRLVFLLPGNKNQQKKHGTRYIFVIPRPDTATPLKSPEPASRANLRQSELNSRKLHQPKSPEHSAERPLRVAKRGDISTTDQGP